MKLIITSLIKAMPAVLNVTGVVIAFQLVFAILGMQLFTGSLGSCTDPEITERALCVPESGDEGEVGGGGDEGEGRRALAAVLAGAGRGAQPVAALALAASPYVAPLLGAAAPGAEAARSVVRRAHSTEWSAIRRRRRQLRGGGGGGGGGGGDVPTEWLNPPWGSFDNIFASMLVLYIASTGDDWETFTYACMDTVGINQTPVRNDFSPNAFFFIVWMFVGAHRDPTDPTLLSSGHLLPHSTPHRVPCLRRVRLAQPLRRRDRR